MIKNIIFDLGGVLIDWNPRYVFKDVFPNENLMEEFLRNICTMEWNVQQDAGRTLKEATEFLQKKHPAWRNEIGLYYGRWEDMLGGPIEETVDLLRTLSKNGNHRLLALTNWSAETFPVALNRYDFLQLFEGIVVSGTEKCIKPDPKIYNIIIERYNLTPSECIFIDDSLKNVEGAKNCGIHALHFTSTEVLRSDLLGLKLL